MKEPLGSRLSSPAIPPPQEVAIGRPTALLLSVTCPVTPVLPSASQRSHPPSPRGRSPCALPVQPSGDCVVLPSDTQSSTCTCKTIRQTRKGAMGRKRRSTFLKKTCEHCLAQAPGQLPVSSTGGAGTGRLADSHLQTPTIAILPLTVTTLPNFPTPETPPYAPPFVPKESILEPPPVEPASLPLDGACSPRARSPSLHRVRVPLPKRSGSPQSVISYDEPRALELPTPVRIAIALHTYVILPFFLSLCSSVCMGDSDLQRFNTMSWPSSGVTLLLSSRPQASRLDGCWVRTLPESVASSQVRHRMPLFDNI